MTNLGRYEDHTTIHAFLFVVGAIGVGISPSGVYGYTVPVLASFLATAIFYYSFSSRTKIDELVILGVILLFPLINSLLHSSEYDRPFWAIRDFARFIFFGILVLELSLVSYKKAQKLFGFGFLLVLLFDFLVIYQGISEELRLAWLDVAANNAFQEYVSDYYRHLGIMGNPNASAAFYGISIFVFIFFEAIPTRTRLFGLALAVLLLFESQSRSYLIATGVSVALGLTAIKISRLAMVGAGASLAIYMSLDVQKSIEIFLARTEELSAFDERIELVLGLINDLDLVKLVLGDPLLPPVVDNDIVFFFLRFGLPVMIFLMVMIFRMLPTDFGLAKTRLMYAFVIFGIIGSLAGGIFGHPGLAFLYVCIFRIFGLIPVAAKQVEKLKPSHLTHYVVR